MRRIDRSELELGGPIIECIGHTSKDGMYEVDCFFGFCGEPAMSFDVDEALRCGWRDLREGEIAPLNYDGRCPECLKRMKRWYGYTGDKEVRIPIRHSEPPR